MRICVVYLVLGTFSTVEGCQTFITLPSQPVPPNNIINFGNKDDAVHAKMLDTLKDIKDALNKKPEETPKQKEESDAGNSICQSLYCDFSSGDSCNWFAPSDSKSQFTPESGRISTFTSGVPGPANRGGKYLGVDLMPSETAVLYSKSFSTSTPKSLLVKFYEATEGIVLSACSNDDSTGCQKLSNVGVEFSDRRWMSKAYTIPEGTEKIFLVAKNTGPNRGGVGIDSVNVIDGISSEDNNFKHVKTLCK